MDRPTASPSSTDNEMFHALEDVSRRMFSAPALPSMLTGASDTAELRARGVQSYGTGPIGPASEGPLGGAHSDDENISIRALEKLVEFTWNVVMQVAASK